MNKVIIIIIIIIIISYYCILDIATVKNEVFEKRSL